jgi:hypothetical protein
MVKFNLNLFYIKKKDVKHQKIGVLQHLKLILGKPYYLFTPTCIIYFSIIKYNCVWYFLCVGSIF